MPVGLPLPPQWAVCSDFPAYSVSNYKQDLSLTTYTTSSGVGQSRENFSKSKTWQQASYNQWQWPANPVALTGRFILCSGKPTWWTKGGSGFEEQAVQVALKWFDKHWPWISYIPLGSQGPIAHFLEFLTLSLKIMSYGSITDCSTQGSDTGFLPNPQPRFDLRLRALFGHTAPPMVTRW